MYHTMDQPTHPQVIWPTAVSLIIARALGGLFWGFAAVHYPSWINKHGGKNDTLWLGW
jgi:hypothetical protein